jgi:hypothetical protein
MPIVFLQALEPLIQDCCLGLLVPSLPVISPDFGVRVK